jgi:hypothetical protein
MKKDKKEKLSESRIPRKKDLDIVYQLARTEDYQVIDRVIRESSGLKRC